MQQNSFQKLLDFLDRLEQAKISHRLERNRTEALMVLIAVPGQRWEVEFFADGTVEIEKFVSAEYLVDKNGLDALFTMDLTSHSA